MVFGRGQGPARAANPLFIADRVWTRNPWADPHPCRRFDGPSCDHPMVLFSVTDLFAVGIGCDVAGAYLLARGLLLSPVAVWQRMTWQGIETRGLSEAEDRTMAVVGI